MIMLEKKASNREKDMQANTYTRKGRRPKNVEDT